jgi:hypothetical protein
MANKSMFYLGITLIIVAVIFLLGNFLGDSTLPILLGIFGIISIGASKYRLMEKRK